MNNQKYAHLFDILIYSMMVVAVGYIVVMTIMGENGELHFKLTLGIWGLIAIILNDFVEPKYNGAFEGFGEQKAKYYILYAVIDAAAYALLFMFVININLYKEPLHYIFLALSVGLFIVRTFVRRRFEAQRSIKKDEEDRVVNAETGEDENLRVIKYK